MQGYVNGSDILCSVGGKAIGHCTSHVATFNTETKDVAVKPLASVAPSNASLYKSKRVTGLNLQVKVDGLQFYQETESGFKAILAPWAAGQTVQLKLFERSQDSAPYASGNFIVSSLEQNAPAGEDASYSATFDNDGPVTIDDTKIDLIATSSSPASGDPE